MSDDKTIGDLKFKIIVDASDVEELVDPTPPELTDEEVGEAWDWMDREMEHPEDFGWLSSGGRYRKDGRSCPSFMASLSSPEKKRQLVETICEVEGWGRDDLVEMGALSEPDDDDTPDEPTRIEHFAKLACTIVAANAERALSEEWARDFEESFVGAAENAGHAETLFEQIIDSTS